ncbi:MAG TPA: hypothetical protein H9909_06365 [Candidatus Mediterraneibacter norfolkensis]|nr:hypothetical protein [Candidatus Mediterraneibacter norfolkensis]
MRRRKYMVRYLALGAAVVILFGCGGNDGRVPASEGTEEERQEQEQTKAENGEAQSAEGRDYDLPVDEAQKTEAREACTGMFELAAKVCPELLQEDPILSDEVAEAVVEAMGTSDVPVSGPDIYRGMENCEIMEAFLKGCEDGESGEITAYELFEDGRIGQKKFLFDRKEMYLFAVSSYWNGESAVLGDVSYSKVKSWSYSEKGWLFYELCAPEYPEVTEPVYSRAMVRVKPLEEECAEITEQYLKPIAYNGNNLFWTDWDETHMEKLDYNGLFEYLYEVRCDDAFDQTRYAEGIPQEEFEEMMTSCLPVSREELREYAAYDSEKEMYEWISLGVGNRTLGAIVSSIPEVTAIEKNGDGTMTLTVDAVCESMADDALFTHNLTVRTDEEGNVRYFSNAAEEGARGEELPEYVYRIQR